MLRNARRATKLLSESSALVVDFVRGAFNDDGGFGDRSAKSDLYYTLFGIESLVALGADLPADRIERYLGSFGKGASLDLVHLSCLARCWASLPRGVPEELSAQLIDRIAACRSSDGAFGSSPGFEKGTVYASFLALGAHEDLGARLPQPERMAEAINERRAADGGFGNEPGMTRGTTPVTAAAMIALVSLGESIPESSTRWLLERRHESGGFIAAEAAPLPDLLSTAVALHALKRAGAASDEFREECVDFVESLWSGTGGFFGHWADETLDCEYTFYGLLALGHLAE